MMFSVLSMELEILDAQGAIFVEWVGSHVPVVEKRESNRLASRLGCGS
jgi:hypothetical protein